MKHLAMKHFAVLGVVCAVLPAQQIHVSGVGEDSEVPPASEQAESPVVTLPGSVEAPLPPVVVRPAPQRPPVSPPAAAFSGSVPAVPGSAPAVSLRLSVPSAPPPEAPRSLLRPATKSFLPADFERDSAFFCQKLIGAWTEQDAYNLLGAPIRRRPAFDADQTTNGQIVAYSDPTSRYRLIELDFAQNTGLLRTVFVYPWKMRWQECRHLWGAQVQSTDANKGRTFYSYVDRRLDVLVDAAGNVISLGLY
jgi:hypothetical protein